MFPDTHRHYTLDVVSLKVKLRIYTVYIYFCCSDSSVIIWGGKNKRDRL